MGGVASKLVFDLGAAQWLMHAAAQEVLAFLDDAAVSAPRGDMTGVFPGIGILRIHLVSDLRRERAQARVQRALGREGVEPRIAENESRGDAEGLAEFRGIGIRRFGGRRLTSNGSQSRCTVPSATSQVISTMSSARMPRAAKRFAQST